MAALGDAPLEKKPICKSGPSPALRELEPVRARLPLDTHSSRFKFKNSPLPSTAVDHFKNAVLAIGLTVRDMMLKQNEANSFALVAAVNRAVDQG